MSTKNESYPKIHIIKKESESKSFFNIKEENIIPLKGRIPEISEADPNIELRRDGELGQKGIYLDSRFNWKIVTDSSGFYCLICYNKKY